MAYLLIQKVNLLDIGLLKVIRRYRLDSMGLLAPFLDHEIDLGSAFFFPLFSACLYWDGVFHKDMPCR